MSPRPWQNATNRAGRLPGSLNAYGQEEWTMSKYRMEDGTIVNTESAARHWDEGTRWNGNNHISRATGSQWEHQTLYESRKGRYYVERTSQWQGSLPSAEWVSEQEAVRWLLTNEYEADDIPEKLRHLIEKIEE